MSRALIFISITMAFSSCHPDKNTAVDLEKIRFQSTDASEIYFRNMRRSYYDMEEHQEAGIELYTLSGYRDLETVNLRPTLAYNWRNDFVAIMVSKSDELKNEESLVLIFESPESQHKLILNDGDIKTQTTLALKLYNGILANNEIYLVQNRQKQPVFKSSEEKELFRITTFDFLRFVEMR
tara:strand:+ start:5427 stop:5969 length:543 start_codon:yes stop_codon:yes gene_type:complete